MPTPKTGYRLKDGTRVPSVTTILSRFKDAGPLIHWSWSVAAEGLDLARGIIEKLAAGEPDARIAATEFLRRDPREFDYRTRRDRAADAGTAAHDMVECWIKRKQFDPTPYARETLEAARPAYEAFLEWADQTRLEVIETEVPLVSERYLFGGTRDAIMIGKRRAIGDWKTSNAVYPEYLCQLAAYAILDEEQGNKIEGGFHLLRFSKQRNPGDPVQFTHHYWSQLDVAREAFLTMRRLYDLVESLKSYV